jgi:hypothetical protein
MFERDEKGKDLHLNTIKACVDQDETEQFNSFLNHLRRFQHS